MPYFPLNSIHGKDILLYLLSVSCKNDPFDFILEFSFLLVFYIGSVREELLQNLIGDSSYLFEETYTKQDILHPCTIPQIDDQTYYLVTCVTNNS